MPLALAYAHASFHGKHLETTDSFGGVGSYKLNWARWQRC